MKQKRRKHFAKVKKTRIGTRNKKRKNERKNGGMRRRGRKKKEKIGKDWRRKIEQE